MWSCATTECTYPVVAADHSGQSRSAIAGTSDYQNGRRLHRPSKNARISQRVHVGACAMRSQFLGRHVPLYPNLEQFVNYFAQGLLFWEALL